MRVPMREVQWCCTETQQCWPWLLVPISILDPNDPSPAKLNLNAVHSGVSFMLKENRTDFLLRSPNTRSKVSLRERSTKPLPFTLDSSKVLWLSGLHFLPVGTAQAYHQHRYSRAGLSKQKSWLPATSVLWVGISSQSKGRPAHFVAHLQNQNQPDEEYSAWTSWS